MIKILVANVNELTKYPNKIPSIMRKSHCENTCIIKKSHRKQKFSDMEVIEIISIPYRLGRMVLVKSDGEVIETDIGPMAFKFVTTIYDIRYKKLISALREWLNKWKSLNHYKFTIKIENESKEIIDESKSENEPEETVNFNVLKSVGEIIKKTT